MAAWINKHERACYIHLPIREAPRGSLAVEKSMGSCVVGVDMVFDGAELGEHQL